jgi:hypothetical protein
MYMQRSNNGPCRWLSAIAMIAIARGDAVAATTCEYTGSYDDIDITYCQVEDSVPESCPIHLVVLRGASVSARVLRGNVEVDVVGQITTIPVDHQVSGVDVYSCDCAAISSTEAFDETTIELVDVHAGEVVAVPGGSRVITPAAVCPTVEWPTSHVLRTSCDLCPEPSADSAGCSSTWPGAGGGSGLVLVAFVFSSRRRRR